MSRWKAAGIHLLISILIATVAIAAVILIMYPPPYTTSAGAGKLLMTLIGVDITLGPLITLIIYKHGKPGLKMDLAIIGSLQIAALVYGLYMIAESRPAYLAFAVDRFSLVPANAISDEALSNAPPEYSRRPWRGPTLVAAVLPTDSAKSESVLMSALAGGADVDALPEFYQPYRNQREVALRRAKPLRELLEMDDARRVAVNGWLNDRHEGDFRYLPLKRRGGFSTVVLNPTGDPAGVIDTDPW